MLQFFDETPSRTPDLNAVLRKCGIHTVAEMYRTKETVEIVRKEFRALGWDFSSHEPLQVTMRGLEALEGTAVEDTDDLTSMDRAVVDQAMKEKGLSLDVFYAAYVLTMADFLK